MAHIKNLIVTLAISTIGTFSGQNLNSQREVKPCEKRYNYVKVDTNTRLVHVCVRGKSINVYKASFGSNGFGKKKRGDRKTPLGEYSLARPRKSVSKWHTFIGIGYPTKSQKKLGYTGSSVGIHGPNQLFPYFNHLKDWGAGCVVLASTSDIINLSKHVKKYNINKVSIVR
jgi:hypothetical protein